MKVMMRKLVGHLDAAYILHLLALYFRMHEWDCENYRQRSFFVGFRVQGHAGTHNSAVDIAWR
jgi:hypothetical protein